MPKNNKHNRRMIITVTVIIAIALAGLSMLPINQVGADRNTTVSDQEAAGPSSGETSSVNTLSGVEEPSASSDPSVVGAVAKMLSALVVVIVLVYGALWALKRLMGRRYSRSGVPGSLEVLQTTYVGQHKAISLVKVGQRSVLVGVTDNQISTLTELNSEETQEIIGAAAEPNQRESFSTILTAAADRLKTIGLIKKQTALET